MNVPAPLHLVGKWFHAPISKIIFKDGNKKL